MGKDEHTVEIEMLEKNPINTKQDSVDSNDSREEMEERGLVDNTDNPYPDLDDPEQKRQMLIRLSLSLMALIAFSVVTAIIFHDFIHMVGEELMDRFALAGIAVGVIFTDSSPFPLTSEPILLLGVSAEAHNFLLLALVASFSSAGAGLVGYLGGKVFLAREPCRSAIERRYPVLLKFLRDNGVKGVAMAALLPIPFSTATWSAGMLNLPLDKFFLACCLRIPKTLFYLTLIKLGWSLGSIGKADISNVTEVTDLEELVGNY